MKKAPDDLELNLRKQVKDNPAFCIMPFNHNYVTTTGSANLCCIADWGNPIEENVAGKNLLDIFRGEEYKRIRTNMLKGIKEKRCYICYAQDKDGGGGSDRVSQNERFLRDLGDDFELDIDVQFPSWSDLRPGRMCNFGCRMCWGAVSTTIDEENRAHPETQDITWDKPVDVDEWLDDPIAFESVKESVKNMNVLKLAGGEPLFMPGVIKLLKWCVESDNTHVALDITTNGSRTKGKVIKMLSKFDKVFIQFSMCGIGYTNDYIRYGADWNELDAAYKQYNEADNIGLNLLATAQIYNIFDLVNIIKYWHENGAQNNLIFNVVNYPEDQRFDLLPKDMRLKIANELEEAMHKYVPVWLHSVSRLDHIISKLRLDFDPEDIAKNRIRLAKRTQMYDRIRNQNIGLVHSELERLCLEWLPTTV
tara:strand:- start:774 stop:2036 length:1263 start_codon:yes stop_codon:yes gene_type:complete